MIWKAGVLITLFREHGLDYNLLLVFEQLLSALLKTMTEMKGSADVQRRGGGT